MKTGTVRLLHHIVIFFGILFLLWGLIQGQKYVLQKDVGVEGTGQIVTETVTPGSIILVDSTSTKSMDTRVIRNDNRDFAYVGNGTYYDKHLSAGGPGEGNGVGTHVSLQALTPTETRYVILIKAPTGSAIDYTEADVSYKVEVSIWTPNYMLMMTGIVLVFSALVLGTVLGVGLFGPGQFRPPGAGARPAYSPAPVPEDEPIEEVPEPTPMPRPAQRRPPAQVPPPEPAYEPRVEVREEELPPEEPAPPPRRGEPTWDVSPAKLDRGAAPPPAEDKRKPLKKIKCSACGAIIPIYTAERPLRVTCPLCGRQGTLTR